MGGASWPIGMWSGAYSVDGKRCRAVNAPPRPLAAELGLLVPPMLDGDPAPAAVDRADWGRCGTVGCNGGSIVLRGSPAGGTTRGDDGGRGVSCCMSVELKLDVQTQPILLGTEERAGLNGRPRNTTFETVRNACVSFTVTNHPQQATKQDTRARTKAHTGARSNYA
jgi:hypothetical protein